MDKFEYFNLRNEAWRFLLENSYNELPIDFTKLERKNFIFREAEKIPTGGDACILPHEDYFIVYVKADLPTEVKNFRIAHEIGHQVLGHYKLTKNEEEKEANMFAARVLMPLVVLEHLNVKKPEDIVRICQVSLTAAQYRFERLEQLRKRNKFLTSDLEKQVLKQFAKFIEKNKF